MNIDSQLISVVVPIYNAEKYIIKCVESILKQTYSFFELILVDDGSTDSSAFICDTMKGIDNRIIVIHKTNGGVSSARNAGIKASSGRYITFIDSDDYIDSKMLEKMVQMMESSCDEIDCSAIGIRFVYNDENKNKDFNLPNVNLDFRENISNYFEKLTNNFGLSCVYAKLYKLSIIQHNNILFCENYSICEDSIFVRDYLKECRIVSFSSNVYYNYRQTDECSLVKRFNENVFEALNELYIREQWMINKLNRDLLDNYYNRWFRLSISYCCKLYLNNSVKTKMKYYLMKRFFKSDLFFNIINSNTNWFLPFSKMIILILARNKRYTTIHMIFCLYSLKKSIALKK